ncbi:uncharacterized protein LOC118737627 isoform X2 [Rhagoletis pomonella]|uniref:uncharacterized protein LOC118737627 isoform X2 n=2 Tax=Rhagoletis pomonella TaxID=28610 RepID=UPI00178320B3|nr:uncharacterized protein LOC118737627 isoform X2 [Rhagoletis pomonella]
MNTCKREKPKCRTCLDTTDKKFHSLNAKLIKGEQRTSLAEFLWEISKMDNFSETAKRLPQQICDSCLRKLKIAFSFVMQVQKVNGSMIVALQREMPINFCQTADEARECFVDCNSSLALDSQDPIGIARAKKRKLSFEFIKRQYINEDSADSITTIFEGGEETTDSNSCKNGCHKEILHTLKSITDRLDTVEGNQKIITTNQGILFKQVKKDETNVIEKEESHLVKKNIRRQVIVQKVKPLVQSPLVTRQCKVFIKKMKQPLCIKEERGNVYGNNELSIRLPFDSHASISRMEEQIEKYPEYAKALTATFEKLRGFSEDVFTVMRNIFSDDVLWDYNWNGSWRKKAFRKLKVLNILRDVFKMQPYHSFELSLKRSFNASRKSTLSKNKNVHIY